MRIAIERRCQSAKFGKMPICEPAEMGRRPFRSVVGALLRWFGPAYTAMVRRAGLQDCYQRHRCVNGVALRTDASIRITSTCQGRRISGDKLDEIGLPLGAGLLKQATEMRLDRGVCNTEGGRDLWNASHFNDGKQHAKFHRR